MRVTSTVCGVVLRVSDMCWWLKSSAAGREKLFGERSVSQVLVGTLPCCLLFRQTTSFLPLRVFSDQVLCAQLNTPAALVN